MQGSSDWRWKALLTYGARIRSPAENRTRAALVGDWHTTNRPPGHSNNNIYIFFISLPGFKSPTGIFAIMGLHVLPIWLYGQQKRLWEIWISRHVELAITGVLVSGRALCMMVEVSDCLGNVLYMYRHPHHQNCCLNNVLQTVSSKPW